MRMHPSNYRVILIESILLWLIAKVESEFKVIKPLGPKMCERYCNEMTVCSFFKFVRTDLSCHVTDKKQQRSDKQTAIFKVAKKKELLYGKHITHCPKFAKIFRTRTNRLQCRKRLFERKQLTDKAQILLYQFWSKQGQLLLLKNNSLINYPHLTGITLSVAYSRSLNKLFITQAHPTLLRAVTVSGRNQVIIKKGLSSRAIAVDDKRKKLFLNIEKDSPKIGFVRGIYSMTTDGYEFKLLLKNNQLDKRYLVVDPNRLRFYVKNVRNYKRHVYTYAGFFLEDISIEMRYADSVKGVLYYTFGYDLYKLFLSNNTKQLIFKSSQYIISLTVYENNVYMNFFSHNGNLEILKRDGTAVKVNHDLGRETDIQMCLIM